MEDLKIVFVTSNNIYSQSERYSSYNFVNNRTKPVKGI